MYLAASNNLVVLYANDLKEACDRLNVTRQNMYTRQDHIWQNVVSFSYIVTETDGFTPTLSSDTYTQKGPYDALSSVTRDQLLLLRPVPLSAGLVRQVLSNFKVVDSHHYQPRI